MSPSPSFSPTSMRAASPMLNAAKLNMLNMALAKMIDKTECFLFLNTENSVLMRNEFSSQETESPWICDELLLASMLTRKSKALHRAEFQLNHALTIFESQQLTPRFVYDISFMEMKCLTYEKLLDIADLTDQTFSYENGNKAEQFLDLLYDKMGVKEKEDIFYE